MTSAWTLPLIRIELDNLPLGCDFALAADDGARLFGTNDAASRLVSVFAASHGCRVVFKSNELVFQKRLQSVEAVPAGEAGAVECFPPLCAPPEYASDDYPAASCH